MKPRCPVPDCCEPMNADRVMCNVHAAMLPPSLARDISRTWAVLKQTRKANLQQAVLRRHRQARQRAIQFVIDNSKTKTVPA